MSTSRHTRLAQDDQNLRWLAQQAPQFHDEEPEPAVDFVRLERQSVDYDSDSSDSDAASEASDLDEDPDHPYNVPDTRRWVNTGHSVYAADERGETQCVLSVLHCPPITHLLRPII